ncbi:bifunctional DedA family/phosphatase PAP2 family protein [Acidimangrovimonas sediminis]|uniref:bifunctional DedA family/phosphatase PAP2 family protein n=1 Tax=Acidimangrovimonas sediminis TaxID=2056283 RepID=UPI000C8103FD|nr:bifunctional DedA family/phosphatase PAP2 family protein [Acidimangrovimonas sediminis]
MPHSIDALLPSLQSLGIWTYWIVGAASMLEAFFLTGVIVPGTLVVDAAGILAQRGYVGFFDMTWFVAIGSILGNEMGFWVGRWGSGPLFRRFDPDSSKAFRKARDLCDRRGGLALVVGRFLGPVSGFVPLAAALAGMEPRRFRIWNVVGSVPYALGHLAFGYFFGDILARLGPATTRIAIFVAAAAVLLAVLIYVVVKLERNLPALLSIGGSYLAALGERPKIRAWRDRHPATVAFLAARVDRGRFLGLPATLIAVAFVYVLTVYLDTVFDFLGSASVVQMDRNVAALMHLFRNPLLIHLAAYVTAFGIWQAVTLVLVATVASLWLAGRGALAVGMITSIVGNVITVAILKMAFHRARPDLAYFVETSGSFPSGHAAISVACYGMLAYVAWRVRLIGPLVAALLALIVAFLIGLSRLYLIEHYLSDVLNGYLVGAMWLLIGVSVGEWLRSRQVHRSLPKLLPPAPRRVARWGATAVWAAALVGCVVVAISYHKALTPPAAPEKAAPVADLSTFFASAGLPGQIQGIDGRAEAPINLVLLAKDRSALSDALKEAGMVTTDSATLSSLLNAVLAELSGKPDPRAPAMPAFWNGTANRMTWVRARPEDGVHKRHLLRVWPTDRRGPDGRAIFVASAGYADAQPWAAVEDMDAKVDRDRDWVVQALSASGQVAKTMRAALPKGDAARKGRWTSDGAAAVVVLK